MADEQAFELAFRITNTLPPEQKEIGILQIMEILAALASIYRNCKQTKKSDILKMTHSPSFRQRLRARIIFRIHLSGIQRKKDIDAIVNAAFGVGKTATETDIDTLLKLSESKID